jgi:peptide-methionine (S)-S-oxide reductase
MKFRIYAVLSIVLSFFLFSCASKGSDSIESMNSALASAKNAKPPLLGPRTTPAQGKDGPRIEEQFGMPVNIVRTDGLQYAILAGGCFWCLGGVYELVPGVEDVISGYEGGSAPSPTYEEVSTGTTGYAESVLILFDPAKVSYGELLDIFWHIHDPTTKDRQGYDVGPQYRSAVFYLNDTQKAEAQKSIRAQQEEWPVPIVTEVRPAGLFWPAEDYHQDFYSNNPDYGYCQVIITPKVEKVFQAK